MYRAGDAQGQRVRAGARAPKWRAARRSLNGWQRFRHNQPFDAKQSIAIEVHRRRRLTLAMDHLVPDVPAGHGARLGASDRRFIRARTTPPGEATSRELMLHKTFQYRRHLLGSVFVPLPGVNEVERRTLSREQCEAGQVVHRELQILQLDTELLSIDPDQLRVGKRALEPALLERDCDVITTAAIGRNQPNDRSAPVGMREIRLLLQRDAERAHGITDVHDWHLTPVPARCRLRTDAVAREDRQRLELGKVFEARGGNHRLSSEGQREIVVIVVRSAAPTGGLERDPSPCCQPQRRVDDSNADRDVRPAQPVCMVRDPAQPRAREPTERGSHCCERAEAASRERQRCSEQLLQAFAWWAAARASAPR